MGHGQKNANRGEAIMKLQTRMGAAERRMGEIASNLKATTDRNKSTERLMAKDSNRILELENNVRKMKLLLVAHQGHIDRLTRPWWRKLLRMGPKQNGALFKLVPLVTPDDLPQDGEEIVPDAEEITEPERDHHVLDIQSGKLGVKIEPSEDQPK